MRFRVEILLVMLGGGCGLADDGPSDDTIGSVEQAINEDGCGTAVEDMTLSTGDYFYVVTPDANYGTGGTHPECPHQFIVDENVNAKHDLVIDTGLYSPVVGPNDYGGCNAMWTTGTLWQWIGNRYHRVSTKSAYGKQYGASCERPVVGWTINPGAHGWYRLVVSSGVIYTYTTLDMQWLTD